MMQTSQPPAAPAFRLSIQQIEVDRELPTNDLRFVASVDGELSVIVFVIGAAILMPPNTFYYPLLNQKGLYLNRFYQ